MKKRINILFQSDDNFAFMVGVSISSLLENANRDVFYDIYYFALNLSEASRKKFEELRTRHPETDFRLTIVDAAAFEKEFVSLGVHDHRGSYVTYFKLLLDRYFGKTDVDRIIHIGADTLVTGSLEGLADFDFQGAPFAMNWTEKQHERYHPWHYRACVAEMVFFNLPEWRKHECEKRIIRHIKEIGDIYGSKDQGILNVEFQDEYAQLRGRLYSLVGALVRAFADFSECVEDLGYSDDEREAYRKRVVRYDNLKKTIDSWTAKEEKNEKYLEDYENSLRKKYGNLDSLLSGYNTSMSYVSSILSGTM